MFDCFLQLQSQMQKPRSQPHQQRQEQLQESPPIEPLTVTYAAAKAANQQYCTAKQQLYQHFVCTTGQVWLKRRSMVPELEDF